MNRYICIILSYSIFCIHAQEQPPQSVCFKGSIIVPWVPGNLCAYYWYEQKHVKNCFEIKAGQCYVIENIPHKVKHLKVTRTFAKTNKKAHGKFFLTPPHTLLTLTYHNNKIFKDFDIPPAKPQSYFGYPQQYGSILFESNYRSLPDSRSV